MRILVVTNMYPPHHYGGYELSCQDTVRRFRDRHDVTVLTTTLRVPGVEAADEPDVRRELDFYWADHKIVRPRFTERLSLERRNQSTLDRVLNDVNPDVVSVWNMGAMSMGLLTTLARRRLPAVLVVCDDWLVYGPRVDPWMRTMLRSPRVARIAELATGVPCTLPDLGANATACFVSHAVRARAERETPWSFTRSTVTYSGIERSDFTPDPSRDGRTWAWRCLYVGRVEPRKGVAAAVEALRYLPDEATLEVVGPVDPHYEETLRGIVRTLGLQDRVSFTVVERHQLRHRYAAADVVVFPSEWAEPFGLVPLEAMACGVPVVATGTGGTGEFLVGELNALLFPPGDARALAAAIGRLASDPDLRGVLIKHGSETAAGLDTDSLAAALEEWHLATAEGFRTHPNDRRLPGPSRPSFSRNEMRQTQSAAIDVLLRDPPRLHGPADNLQDWGFGHEGLRWLATNVRPGWVTLETGCGHSTIVFAAAGASHTVVAPYDKERDRILEWCKDHGVATDGIEFVLGESQFVLPALPVGQLDLVLIDGSHSFPVPFIDWYYAGTRLRIGGLVVLDDTNIRAVRVLRDFLAAEKTRWFLRDEFEHVAVFEKLRPDLIDMADWVAQPWSYKIPSRGERLVQIRHRIALRSRLRRALGSTRRA